MVKRTLSMLNETVSKTEHKKVNEVKNKKHWMYSQLKTWKISKKGGTDETFWLDKGDAEGDLNFLLGARGCRPFLVRAVPPLPAML